jgi:hypothetical protein
MKGYEGYLGHELLHDLDDPGAPVRRRRVNGVNPSALVALANLQRRRRWDTAPAHRSPMRIKRAGRLPRRGWRSPLSPRATSRPSPG